MPEVGRKLELEEGSATALPRSHSPWLVKAQGRLREPVEHFDCSGSHEPRWVGGWAAMNSVGVNL